MNEEDNMHYDVLMFIGQAARDCEIRAKDVMAEVKEEFRLPNQPNLKLRLNGKIIAMGMSHYRGHGNPCNGFHELFFNGLMFVLHGVVGDNLADLDQMSSCLQEVSLERKPKDADTPWTPTALSIELEMGCAS